MKLGYRMIGLSCGVACAAFVACADSEDAPLPTSEVDASIPPSGEDAATPDADVDAGSPDASAPDATARECSDDGLCPTALPAGASLRGVWGDGTGAVWSVSAEGSVLRWDGAAWTTAASKLGSLHAIWGSGPTDIWVGGQRGLFHGTGTSPAAVTFTAVETPGDDVPITAIWGTDANDVWAVGGLPPDRNVYPYGPARTRVLHRGAGDAGAAWTVDPASARGVGFTAVWGSAQDGVFLLGLRAMEAMDYADEAILLWRAASADDFTSLPLPTDPAAYSTEDGTLSSLGGAAMAPDGSSWIQGRTLGNTPARWRAARASAGASPSFVFEPAGGSLSPSLRALAVVSANEAWAVGDYGRVQHFTGAPGPWPQAAVTWTKYPVVDDFHALWAKDPNDVWIVGDGIALRLDPSKKVPRP